MSTWGVLLLRLACSAGVSCLAVCASVLAHLLAAGHAPGARTVLVIGALVTLADLVVAPWSRRTRSLALRVAALQGVVHIALTVSSLGAAGVPPTAGHHVPAALAPGVATTATRGDLLPSAPMLLVHAGVAVLVAVAVTRSGRALLVQRSFRLSVAGVRRFAAAWRPARLPVLVAVAVRGPETSSPRSRPPVARPARSVWQAAVRVRRGPPSPLAA